MFAVVYDVRFVSPSSVRLAELCFTHYLLLDYFSERVCLLIFDGPGLLYEQKRGSVPGGWFVLGSAS